MGVDYAAIPQLDDIRAGITTRKLGLSALTIEAVAIPSISSLSRQDSATFPIYYPSGGRPDVAEEGDICEDLLQRQVIVGG